MKITKVGHVVLAVRDVEASIKFYTDVLGMELLNFTPQIPMGFLSFGARDHDIALVKAPEGAPTGSQGMSHTALEVDGDDEELRGLYNKLRDSGAKIDFSADHGVTRGFYFFDPDGNRIELFIQVLRGADAMTFMRDKGAVLDPYEIEPRPAP